MNLKVKLKPSMYILKEGENKYKFILTGSRKVLTYEIDSLVKDTIDYLTKERSYNELINYLSENYKIEDAKNCIKAMESQSILRVFNKENEDVKFKKQIEFLDEFTSSYDETLKLHKGVKGSRITIFGVGGIGSWIVNGLSQIGVGKMVICDPDKVELSNLNRQLFFSEKDVGKYKVDVIKENLPDVLIETHKRFVSQKEDLEDLVQNSNFIVNCADSPSVQETSEIIDSYATRFNIPYLVSGGYNLHLGMIGPIIIPGKTLTFSDFLKHQKRNDKLSSLEKIKNIEATGNLGPIAGAVANIQVMEIFKYLTGKGTVNYNKFAEIDFMDFSVTWNQFGPEINL
ncbi:MAG: ThiF family adenylyltransferase [Nanoarchaeota archaeon]|nr:ThiF family adenylyltransferase [Nanoarchaeota archaeon]